MWDLGRPKCNASRILKQQSAAIATSSVPSVQTAHMGMAGPHDMATEFIWHVPSESQKVWRANATYRDGLIKAHADPGGTMAPPVRELQLHQEAKGRDVTMAALN